MDAWPEGETTGICRNDGAGPVRDRRLLTPGEGGPAQTPASSGSQATISPAMALAATVYGDAR